MKKNKMMRLASLLLVCVLLTTSVISGTFAKYTSTASANDVARVAKWSIEVNGTDIAVASPTTVFDLFNTVFEVGTTDNDLEVADGAGEVIIAPGTSGSFDLQVQNSSEVKATFEIDLKVLSNDKNIPIQYSLTGADGSWTSNIDDIDTAATDIDMNSSATVTVYWKWAFVGDGVVPAQDDAYDTALGIAADDEATAPSITIQATITATQVD